MTHIFGGKVSYWVVRGHQLADDDLKKIVAAKMIGMPLPVDSEGQKSDDETLGVVQDATAMDECVDTGTSAVNERGNTSENQADTIVVHSDFIGEL